MNCELIVDDLSALAAADRDVQVQREIERLMLEPVDLAVGPLFVIRVFRLLDDEHVLIVATEHIISDGFSLNVLWQDLFAAYTQALQGREFSLPAIPMQFADYAIWQRGVQKSWVERHGLYWSEHLDGCTRVRFPSDRASPGDTKAGWAAVRIRIDRDLKTRLHEWCRRKKTTLAMSVFAAYAGLVLRWCDVPRAAFQYQIDGRISPNINGSIGYFASRLYLRIGLDEETGFSDLVDEAMEEYCKAYEHADSSYLASQMPEPEFTRNAAFNWLPQRHLRIELSDLGGSEGYIACSPIRFVNPAMRTLKIDSEPEAVLAELDEEILGNVYFPLNRFSVDGMERFSRNFLVFVETLVKRPNARVTDILLT